jgi:hypothetical protein
MKLPRHMRVSSFKFLLSILAIGSLVGCEAESEELELEKPEAYIIPLQVGKSITYQLDSTVFTQAGRQMETHSYQEKNVIDGQFIDNSGRTSYRIYRYLRNEAGTSPWIPAGTHTITALDNTVEVNQNNIRIIALSGPLKEGQTWKGNKFVGPEPYASFYNFSNDDNLNAWDFEITSVGGTEIFNNRPIENIITVNHVDEIVNVSPNNNVIDEKAYASKIVSIDKYAKGIGLVYQEYILWEYQPNPNGTPYKTGFGVKRSLLEHN